MSSQIDIILRVKDDGSVTLQKVAAGIKDVGAAAQDADRKLKGAGGGVRSFADTASKIDGAGRQARIGLGAAAQAAEQLGVNIGGVVAPAAGAADAIGDMVGAGAALGPIGIAVGALVVGIGLAAAAIDKYNQSQAATVMQTDAVIQSMRGIIETNKAAAAAAQEYALAQAQAITYAQKGLSTNLGDYAQSAADAVLALDKATGGLMQYIPQWQQQVIGARALGEAVETSAEKADKLRAALVNLPFNEMRDALNQLRAQNPFERLAESAGLSADKLKEMAAASESVRNALNDLISVEQTLAILQAQRAELQRQLADAQVAGDTSKVTELTAKLDENTAAMERVKAKADEIRAALDEQTAAIEGNTRRWEALNGVLLRYAETSSQASLTANRWAQYNRAIAESLGMTESQMEKSGTTLEQYNANLKKLAEEGMRAAEQAARRLRDTIRSLVEQALTPTAVTMEDLNAALAGKYIPKWDEFRRRVEAIATGTSIEQFGEKFKAQLEMVQRMFGDLSLEQIAAKFKDFSLFADMDFGSIKQLIDFGQIEAQVAQQVDSIIGKAKAMKVAFDDVWASLSTQKKIDLADALGLDASAVNVEGLKNQIQGAVTGATQGVGDAATQALSSGLSTAASHAGTLATKISTALAPGLNNLNDALAPVNPALSLMNAQLGGILTSAQGIKPAIDGDRKAFDDWTQAMPGYAASIQSLIADALEPLRAILSSIVSELEEIIKKANEAAAALAGMGVGAGGGANANAGTPPAPGFQRGADFIVPPGFPGDTFPFRGWLTSGERVTITPPQHQTHATGGTFIFNVTVDSDARSQQLARRVRALAAHGIA